MARSALRFGMGMAFPSGALPVGMETNPPAAMIRSSSRRPRCPRAGRPPIGSGAFPAAGVDRADQVVVDARQRLRAGVDSFRTGYDELVGGWRDRLTELHGDGKTAVIWASWR